MKNFFIKNNDIIKLGAILPIGLFIPIFPINLILLWIQISFLMLMIYTKTL